MSYTAWNNEDKSLQAYLNEISSSNPVEREQERALGERIQAGDEAARDELVQANLRFVISVAQKYQNRGLTMGELISAGNMGLLTAAQRFDSSRGLKFISYAVWWVRQAISHTLSEEVRTVHLPQNKVQLLHKITQMTRHLNNEGTDQPALEEIAAALDVSVEEVRQTVLSGRAVRSLDQEMGGTDERSLMETLVDANQEAPDAHLLRTAPQQPLKRVLASLDPREQRILSLYFGLDGNEPLTLGKIGSMMDLTRERIRQLKEQALNRLRHPSRHDDLCTLESALGDS